MNPEPYVGEKIIWLLGSLLLALLGMLFGNMFGGHDKVDKSTCEERRSACSMHTNSMLAILQKDISVLSTKIDELIKRD